MRLHRILLAAVFLAAPARAQSNDPYPPIRASDDVVRVDVREFATLPDIDGVAARMMLLVQEPGARNRCAATGAARRPSRASRPGDDRGQLPDASTLNGLPGIRAPVIPTHSTTAGVAKESRWT